MAGPVVRSKKFGERTFIFGNIPATDAIDVEVTLVRVLGEPLFRAFMDSDKTGESKATEIEAIGNGIALLMTKLSAPEIKELHRIVLSSVEMGNLSINTADRINVVFTGKPKEIWLVFMEALKANFTDFLPDDLPGTLEALKAKMRPKDLPPT